MKKLLLAAGILLLHTVIKAQLLTWSPQFPTDNSTIIITMDATKGNQGLKDSAGPIYMHLGVITNLSTNSDDWKYVFTEWGTTTAPRATSLGNNKWSFTITNPRAYFNSALGGVPAGETILKVALLFRTAIGGGVQRNTDGSNMYIPIYPAGSSNIRFTTPPIIPVYNKSNEVLNATVGQTFPVTATASTANRPLNLYHNGVRISGPTTANTISGTVTISATGTQQIISELVGTDENVYDTVQFYVAAPNTILPLPAGVREGINYGAGCDSVTLVLYAPNKQNIVVLGDFPGGAWVSKPELQMNKTADGNYYWLTLHNLVPGFEYSFQYLVDNAIYIADPYTEKILDPWNDQYIPAATYPNLKPYPSDPNVSSGKNGFVGTFKTCAEAYNWKVTNFARPDKRHLVIYELLVRDFGTAKNYQMLIDTISYFKRLGVNAIELMPVAEFSGNESWGYNPNFYCALDKAYGTKEKFKEFIDLCHQNGIAVILDVVYNQLDAYNAPEGKLYWNPATNKPAANNPWLNQSAPHPYSVFEDLNHSSTATQYWVKRALEYWLKEYKVDGYRFDLAKGFTQKVTDAATVEEYDGGRYGNLARYYDYVNPLFPGTYMILEFLGQQRTEEKLYASKGFMLWSECTDRYNEATMGFANANADFSKIMYNSAATDFGTPAAVGYMESHDKERLMFKNLSYGNANGAYNVRDTATALVRQAAAAAVFLVTPGPKMIWQFGERGYGVSIEANGRTGNKPPMWEQMADPRRLKLWDVYAKLINLRVSNPGLFNSVSYYEFNDNNGLYKRFKQSDPSANGLKMMVVANLDVSVQTRSVTFQNTGNWYNYVSNGTGTGINGNSNANFNLSDTTQNITLQPGEYHVYLYHPANVYMFNGDGNWNNAANWTYNTLPPASLPSGAEIFINPKQAGKCTLNISQTIGAGAKITVMAGKNIEIPLNLSIQ